MTPRGPVLRNSVYLVAGGAAERAASLVVAVILSRSEGVAGLGAYVTVIAYFQLLTVAAELGVSNYLVREIATDLDHSSRWISHAVGLAAGVALTVTAAALVVIPHLGFDATVRDGMTVAMIGVLPAALNVVSRAVFVAHQRVAVDASANAVASVALVASGWVMLRLGWGVTALVAGYVATRVLVTVVSFVVIHRRIAPLEPTFDRAFAGAMLRGIRPFAGSTVVGAAFARPEVLVLALLASPKAVGEFGAAFKTVDLWQLIPETYMLNAYPVLARTHEHDAERAAELQRRATTGLLAIGLPISVGLAVSADSIIPLLYGSDFGGAVTLLRIMAVLATLFCVHAVLWRSLSARGEQSTVLRIQVPTLAFRLAFGVIVIAWFGGVGAAVAVPVCLAVHNLALARAVRRGGPGVVDVAEVWPFVVGALACGATVLVVDAADVLVDVVVGVAVYAAVVALLTRGGRGRERTAFPAVRLEREPT